LTGLLYVLLMASGLPMGEHGVDVGHDVDLGHDVHVDAGHDVHADSDHSADGAHPPHPHPGLVASMLSLLGVGKVPLSILIISACLIWGGIGLVLNLVFGSETVLRTIAFSIVGTIGGTRLIAEGLSRVLPSEESYHTPKEELIGQVGEVLYAVSATSGTVRLCDPTGNLVDLDCRTGGPEPIKAGTRVVLTDYDPTSDLFFVHVPGGEQGDAR
jgi:membrane protein implicated in regulation of membrane protease activity